VTTSLGFSPRRSGFPFNAKAGQSLLAPELRGVVAPPGTAASPFTFLASFDWL